LRVLTAEPELAATARVRTGQLGKAACAAGLASGRPDAAILSVPIGAPDAAVAAAAACRAHGVRVGCFRPPSVPLGHSCLRLTGRANLTDVDLERATGALAAAALTT
jgi:8-amino-7-oxononanoate synthase